MLKVVPPKDGLTKSLLQQWHSPGYKLCLSSLSFQYKLNSRRKVYKQSPFAPSRGLNKPCNLHLVYTIVFHVQTEYASGGRPGMLSQRSSIWPSSLFCPLPEGAKPSTIEYASAPVMLSSNECKPLKTCVGEKERLHFLFRNNFR